MPSNTSISRAGFADEIRAKKSHRYYTVMPSLMIADHASNHARAPLYSLIDELPELADHPAFGGNNLFCFRRSEVLERLESFKKYGQQEAIKVYRTSTMVPEVAAGFLRHSAALLAEVTGVLADCPGMRDGLRCEAEDYPKTQEDQLSSCYKNRAENERKETTAIDDAWFAKRLLMQQVSRDEIAERIGVSRVTVDKYLRLLTLPPATQIDVHEGRISYNAALADASAKGRGSTIGPRPGIRHTDIRVALMADEGGDVSLPSRGLSAARIRDLLSVIAGTKPITDVDEDTRAWLEPLSTRPVKAKRKAKKKPPPEKLPVEDPRQAKMFEDA